MKNKFGKRPHNKTAHSDATKPRKQYLNKKKGTGKATGPSGRLTKRPSRTEMTRLRSKGN